MEILKIFIGKEVVRARMLKEKTPNICRIIKEQCPIQGRLCHSKICDNEIFFQVPFFIDYEENSLLPNSGDIGFWNVKQEICIWYDNMVPLGRISIFAKVISNFEGLRKEGKRTWVKQGVRIRLDVEE